MHRVKNPNGTLLWLSYNNGEVSGKKKILPAGTQFEVATSKDKYSYTKDSNFDGPGWMLSADLEPVGATDPGTDPGTPPDLADGFTTNPGQITLQIGLDEYVNRDAITWTKR